jgi:hypothetical protein
MDNNPYYYDELANTCGTRCELYDERGVIVEAVNQVGPAALKMLTRVYKVVDRRVFAWMFGKRRVSDVDEAISRGILDRMDDPDDPVPMDVAVETNDTTVVSNQMVVHGKSHHAGNSASAARGASSGLGGYYYGRKVGGIANRIAQEIRRELPLDVHNKANELAARKLVKRALEGLKDLRACDRDVIFGVALTLCFQRTRGDRIRDSLAHSLALEENQEENTAVVIRDTLWRGEVQTRVGRNAPREQ